MKARVIETNEIVDMLPYAEEDGAIRFYANMEDKWYEAYEIDIVSEVTPPDYWEKLKHQAAITAMQGIINNNGLLTFLCEENMETTISDTITSYAHIIATKLVNKLKEESQCEK